MLALEVDLIWPHSITEEIKDEKKLYSVTSKHLDGSQLSRVNKHLERDKYFSQPVSETEAHMFKNKFLKREERK